MKRAPISDILWLFIGTRLLLIGVTYLSFILFPVPPHVYPSTPVNVQGLLLSWNQWDAPHYIEIARYGYTSRHLTAFFPLFPLLMKAVAFVFGNHLYWLAAMLISNAALFGALYMLYQIAAEVLGERGGRRTILYLCLFPTAFFFFAGYNESLFIFLSCSSIFAMRHQKWLLAGGLGLLASLTRSAGVLLVLPYLCELWMARDRFETNSWLQFRRLLFKGLPMALIPLGLLFYAYYCWRQFGNPMAFSAAEKWWGKGWSFPWSGILGNLHQLFFQQPFGSFLEPHLLLDLGAILAFIVLTILGARRFRLSYTVWNVALIMLLLCTVSSAGDYLVSDQRYVLELFPAFILLASFGLKHPRLHQALLISFPFLQAILAALFVLGRWMV